MDLTLASSNDSNLIRSYAAGEIRVGEQRIAGSCIITPHSVLTDVLPQRLQQLSAEHIERILQLAPDVVLTGTYPTQQFPAATIRALLHARGVAIEAMELGSACRTYNVLVQDRRNPVALLFP